jgi:hypothetical protein
LCSASDRAGEKEQERSENINESVHACVYISHVTSANNAWQREKRREKKSNLSDEKIIFSFLKE